MSTRKARGALLGTLFEKLLDHQGLFDPTEPPTGYAADDVDVWWTHGHINAKEIRDWLIEQAQDFGVTIQDMDLCESQAAGIGIPKGLWALKQQSAGGLQLPPKDLTYRVLMERSAQIKSGVDD